jgi:hypothetical protein
MLVTVASEEGQPPANLFERGVAVLLNKSCR